MSDFVARATELAALLDKPQSDELKKMSSEFDPILLCTKVRKKVKEFFNICKTKILPIPEKSSSQVISDFLTEKPPFDQPKNKKAEFPVAFVIHALEEASNRAVGAIYVISNDDDFKRACDGRSKLIHLHRLSQLVNLAQKPERCCGKPIPKISINSED